MLNPIRDVVFWNMAAAWHPRANPHLETKSFHRKTMAFLDVSGTMLVLDRVASRLYLHHGIAFVRLNANLSILLRLEPSTAVSVDCGVGFIPC